MDHAVASGLCAVHSTPAWGERYDVAADCVAGVDVYRVGADAGVDPRVVRVADDGDSECGICGVGG